MTTHCRPFVPMATVIPEGRAGDFAVEHFTVGNDMQFRAILHPHEYVQPGVYARLVHGRHLLMSDTQHEQRTNIDAVLSSRQGHVLIGGLGLGMILIPLLRNPKVRSVTVIEKHPEVVQLVEAPLRAFVKRTASRKLTIVLGDVATWAPVETPLFDYIYFDIWANTSTDCLALMNTLHRRYRRLRHPAGTVTSWKYDELKRRRRQERP
jgi:spermidine synthase